MLKKVVIYKAPIYRLFSDDVKLENGVIIPNVESEVAHDEELFYSLYRTFVNIKYDCVLASRDEALDFLNYAVSKNKNKIESIIEKQDDDLSKYLKAITSCLYFNESEIKRSKFISKPEFKELKKSYEKKK